MHLDSKNNRDSLKATIQTVPNLPSGSHLCLSASLSGGLPVSHFLPPYAIKEGLKGDRSAAGMGAIRAGQGRGGGYAAMIL